MSLTDEQKREADRIAALERLERQERERLNRQKTIDDLKLQIQLEEELGLIATKRVTQAKLEIQEKEKIKDFFENMLAMARKEEDIKNEIASIDLNNIPIINGQRAAAQARLDALNQELANRLQIENQISSTTLEITRLTVAQQELNDSTNEYLGFWGGIASKVGLGGSKITQNIMNLKKMVSKFNKDTAEGQQEIKRFNEALAETAVLAIGSIAESIVGSFIQIAMEVDNAQASMAKATGGSERFSDNLTTLRTDGFSVARSMESITNSLTSMNRSLIGLNGLSEETINYIGAMGSDFQRLGVDSETFTKSLNVMSSSMGISQKNAADLTQELALAGKELGISSDIMMKDFVAASSTLAVYGDKSIKVFKGLAAAARTAGVEVSELISIAGKFNTFASAAETAGKLNAILGSQISATKMLQMSDEERIETLVRSVQAQGVAFKDMDKFTQMAIAQAAGISDMAKANQIFGMSMSEYKKSQKEMQRQKDVQEEFNKAVSSTITLQEALTAAFQSLAANESFINFIIGFVDTIVYAAQKLAAFNEFFNGIPAIIAGVAAALAFAAVSFAPFLGLLGAIAPVAAPLTGLLASLGTAITGFAGMFTGAMVIAAKGLAIFILAAGAATVIFMGFSMGISMLSTALQGLKTVNITQIGKDLLYFIGVLTGGALGSFAATATVSALSVSVGLLSVAFGSLSSKLATTNVELDKFVQNLLDIDNMDVSVTFEAVTKGVKEIYEEVGKITGDQAIRFHSVLANMALISSGRATFAGTQAAVNNFSPVINLQSPEVSVLNDFGSLELVIEDGEKFKASIRKIVKE